MSKYLGIVLVAVVAIGSGCLEGPDTTTCSTTEDCFLQEACRDGVCVPSGFSGNDAATWPYRECSFDILADPAACGDGLCDPEIGEAQSNCGTDCNCNDDICDPSEVGLCLQCGTVCDFDLVCEEGESVGSCADCPDCGDNLCQLGELDECERDCGSRRSPPLAVFVNAVLAQPAAFFLATDEGQSLSVGLAPGDASPVYDVQVGQSIGVRFGRNDGRGGFNNEVSNKRFCFGTVQLIAGTEDQQGLIDVHTFDLAPAEVHRAVANLRVINLSDYLGPVRGGLDENAPGGSLGFLEASSWVNVPLGDQKLFVRDGNGTQTDWPFRAAGGDIIFAVIRAGAVGENGGRDLKVSFVHTGKLQ